jgi:hypothetical protein
MADQHTRKHGGDHGDSDDTPIADNVSDTLTATTLDDEIANGEWEDWDENCEDTAFVCLFCPETFRSRGDTLQHCLSHKFNYNNIKKEWGMLSSYYIAFTQTCPSYLALVANRGGEPVARLVSSTPQILALFSLPFSLVEQI